MDGPARPADPGPVTGRVPVLSVTTSAVDDPGPLMDLLPAGVAPLTWVRRGDGLVAWGEAARTTVSGPARFSEVRRWWTDVVAASRVRDEVGVPGSGLVSWCSFAFDDTSTTDSVAVVPAVVVGRRAGRSWVTRIRVVGDGHAGAATDLRPAVPMATAAPVSPGEPSWADGALGPAAWEEAVAAAVCRIRSGAAEKVVLARDTVARTREPIDVRWPLTKLSMAYLPCWTFCVEGLFGATPELLLRSDHGLVTSRVLAGTIGRTGDLAADAVALAATLAHSSKDLSEHRLAVESAARVLAAACESINVPDEPFVLHLPNVLHLATDVTGVLASRAGLLELVARLHPTAAVGGTPQAAALGLITELEGMDRGRYAGPVGWVDARGDGEFGIALRCAQLDPDDARQARAFAGCGIVADSDPAAELAESVAKLVPIRDALSS